MNKIKKLTQKYQNVLTKLEIGFLTKFLSLTSNFSGLPKIHISDLILEPISGQNKENVGVLELSDLNLRPIAAGTTCTTRPLSDL